jgi:hypothetical protein
MHPLDCSPEELLRDPAWRGLFPAFPALRQEELMRCFQNGLDQCRVQQVVARFPISV